MRLYLIINDFIEKKDYCSLEFFMDKYSVSKRTIQNDISYLMRISPRNGFQIHTKRGSGYLLEVTNGALFDDFVESLNQGMYFNVKERPAHILAYLAIQDDYISMDSIADFFQVSKALIKSDLKEVGKIAETFHLTLERKAHYGTKVVASRYSLKKYLVCEYQNENVIIQTAINDVVKDFSDIEKILVKQLNKKGLSINYNELLNVIEYLKVTVYASFRSNETYQYSEQSYTDDIDEIILYIIYELMKKYEVGFDQDAIEDLEDIFHKNIRKTVDEVSYLDCLEADIQVFLKQVDEHYSTSFNEDEDFKKLLFNHVALLVNRLNKKISYSNPLAHEISITNPMVFDIAIQFSDMLSEKYGVESTFDETGFVATHFAAHMEKEKQSKLRSFNKIGVVCSSGGGSAYMIKMQIESLFPYAEVATFSFLQQTELEKYQPELIFTVMPLSINLNVPIIYIKELLDDRDLVRIRQLLQCDEYDPYMLMNESPMYYSFFSKEFFKKISGDDYLDIIKRMSDELELKGYGNSGFSNLVLEREKYIDTVYMNGICIPHPLEIDAKQGVISVALMDKPFVHKGKEVKMIFLICLRKNQLVVYKQLTKKLYQLMKSHEYSHKMTNVKTFEEMMSVFIEMRGITNE